MDNEELKKKIAEMYKKDRGESAAFEEVLGKLRGLAAAIEASLVPDIVKVRVEAGHRVNIGQQYSFVIDAPKASLRDVLLRAYVPKDGYPVTLDLFDDERPKCATVDDLEEEILRFLGNPDVMQRLLEVKHLAADHAA